MTIKQKLIAIGVVAVASLAVMAGISFYSESQVADASAENEVRAEQIRNVNAMRRATLEIMLAAMDSLVDKEEGTILPERRETVKQNVSFLRERVQQLIADALFESLPLYLELDRPADLLADADRLTAQFPNIGKTDEIALLKTEAEQLLEETTNEHE